MPVMTQAQCDSAGQSVSIAELTRKICVLEGIWRVIADTLDEAISRDAGRLTPDESAGIRMLRDTIRIQLKQL